MSEKQFALGADPPPYEKQPITTTGPISQSQNSSSAGPVVPTGPIKQYEVFRQSSWSPTKLEIRQNGHTILRQKKDSHPFKAPNLHITLDNGQVVAAVALQSMTRNQMLYLGSQPDTNNLSQWIELDCSGFTAGKFSFMFNGGLYSWTRTRQFSTFAGRDFKLVDQQGKVLVIYRYNTSMFKNGRMAEIDYFVELGQDLELLSLAAIMGIELRIQRQKNHSAASSGGGGGG